MTFKFYEETLNKIIHFASGIKIEQYVLRLYKIKRQVEIKTKKHNFITKSSQDFIEAK